MDVRMRTVYITILAILMLASGDKLDNPMSVRCRAGNTWTITPKGDICLRREVINVTSVYVHTSATHQDGYFLNETDPFYKEIKSACNGQTQCTTTNLTKYHCAKYNTTSVVRTCINQTSVDQGNDNKSTISGDNSDMISNENSRITSTNVDDGSTEEDRRMTSTNVDDGSTEEETSTVVDNNGRLSTRYINNDGPGSSVDNDSINKNSTETIMKDDGSSNEEIREDEETDSDDKDDDKDDSEENIGKTKVIIIAVVISLVFLVALVTVTICLLFYCCANSPVYKGSTWRRGRREQRQYECQQEEYDNVDGSKIEALKSYGTENIYQHKTIPIFDHNGGTSNAHDRIITSEYEDYAEISSNESFGPIEKSSPGQSATSVTFLPTQPGPMSPSGPTISQAPTASSSPEINRYQCLSKVINSEIRHTLSGQARTKSNTSYANNLPSAKNEGNQLPDYDEVDDNIALPQNVPVKMSNVPEGIYSLTSPKTLSPAPDAADYHSMNSLTKDYAHLIHPGEEARIIDNIYNG